MEEQETKLTNLYKVWARGWNSPVYVAADCQQEAIDKVAPAYEGTDKATLNVEYQSEVFI